jgi:hypothetical protein
LLDLRRREAALTTVEIFRGFGMIALSMILILLFYSMISISADYLCYENQRIFGLRYPAAESASGR